MFKKYVVLRKKLSVVPYTIFTVREHLLIVVVSFHKADQCSGFAVSAVNISIIIDLSI